MLENVCQHRPFFLENIFPGTRDLPVSCENEAAFRNEILDHHRGTTRFCRDEGHTDSSIRYLGKCESQYENPKGKRIEEKVGRCFEGDCGAGRVVLDRNIGRYP